MELHAQQSELALAVARHCSYGEGVSVRVQPALDDVFRKLQQLLAPMNLDDPFDLELTPVRHLPQAKGIDTAHATRAFAHAFAHGHSPTAVRATRCYPPDPSSLTVRAINKRQALPLSDLAVSISSVSSESVSSIGSPPA